MRNTKEKKECHEKFRNTKFEDFNKNMNHRKRKKERYKIKIG